MSVCLGGLAWTEDPNDAQGAVLSMLEVLFNGGHAVANKLSGAVSQLKLCLLACLEWLHVVGDRGATSTLLPLAKPDDETQLGMTSRKRSQIHNLRNEVLVLCYC